MSTRQVIALPLLPKYFVGSGRGIDTFTLYDVGASGGIDEFWKCFGGALRAVGFDPLLAEVERLNQSAQPGLRYEAALVGCRRFDELFPPALRSDAVASRDNGSFGRTSAWAAQSIEGNRYVQDQFNSGAPVQTSERLVDLDEFVESANERPDFLKIDTDGHDIEVLAGAERLLRSPDLLGISVEAQFHGAVHPYANTFSNLDRILREAGFTLMDLDIWRYSRAALPSRFYYEIFGQTERGQIQFAEAVYLRDAADPQFEAKTGLALSFGARLKLACLNEIFGMPDGAAEILAALPRGEGGGTVGDALDALAKRYGEASDYTALQDRFRAKPRSFFPAPKARRSHGPFVRWVARLLGRGY